MIIVCKNCTKRYLVKDSAIGQSGRMVRCPACRETWFQKPLHGLQDSDRPEGLATERDTSTNDLGESRKQEARAVGDDQQGKSVTTGAPRYSPGSDMRKTPAFLRSGKHGTGINYARSRWSDRRRNPNYMAGLMVSLVFGVVLLFNFFWWSGEIMEAVPLSKPAYALFGIDGAKESSGNEANLPQMKRKPDFSDLELLILGKPKPKIGRSGDTNVEYVVINIAIVNPTDQVIDLVPLEGILFDAQQKPVHSWKTLPPASQILAGRRLDFKTTVSFIPKEARSIRIDFVGPESDNIPIDNNLKPNYNQKPSHQSPDQVTAAG